MKYRTNNGMVQTFNMNSLNELTTVTRSGTLTVAGLTIGGATGTQRRDGKNHCRNDERSDGGETGEGKPALPLQKPPLIKVYLSAEWRRSL